MKLIVGLGNPGRGYINNRHNVGFACLNYFAKKQGIRFDKKQGKARIGIGKIAGNRLVVAKPQTYMNQSGQAVSRLIEKYDISLNDLLVIHDDLDLPIGKIRIRFGGGSGGHNGVSSTIDSLGSRDFTRIRVGISRPTLTESNAEIGQNAIITYVLSNFTPDEKQTITQVIPRVNEAILCFLVEGLTTAMNKYN